MSMKVSKFYYFFNVLNLGKKYLQMMEFKFEQ